MLGCWFGVLGEWGSGSRTEEPGFVRTKGWGPECMRCQVAEVGGDREDSEGLFERMRVRLKVRMSEACS